MGNFHPMLNPACEKRTLDPGIKQHSCSTVFLEKTSRSRQAHQQKRDLRLGTWNPEGRRPLGRPRHRWKDNIRMDLQDVGVWSGWS
jgi:hypothetical protein